MSGSASRSPCGRWVPNSAASCERSPSQRQSPDAARARGNAIKNTEALSHPAGDASPLVEDARKAKSHKRVGGENCRSRSARSRPKKKKSRDDSKHRGKDYSNGDAKKRRKKTKADNTPAEEKMNGKADNGGERTEHSKSGSVARRSRSRKRKKKHIKHSDAEAKIEDGVCTEQNDEGSDGCEKASQSHRHRRHRSGTGPRQKRKRRRKKPVKDEPDEEGRDETGTGDVVNDDRSRSNSRRRSERRAAEGSENDKRSCSGHQRSGKQSHRHRSRRRRRRKEPDATDGHASGHAGDERTSPGKDTPSAGVEQEKEGKGQSDKSDTSGAADQGGHRHGGRRVRRRRRSGRHAHRTRSRSRQAGRHRRSRRRAAREGRSKTRQRMAPDPSPSSDGGVEGSFKDKRPMVERVKGGVKMFVGRLPLEATSQSLTEAFKEFGEVLEVFLIDSARATSGARCAFVRIGSLEAAEKAINDMHEKRVLVPGRQELGPIQVAFAKGETARFGLDPEREQLPARWQVPAGDAVKTMPAAPVDPEALSKEALVSLVKEGQRTGGQPFKQQWWGYCDSGKGGVHDYDPKRHSRASLRQFFVAAQQGEWGAKPWFRRAIHWALLGGRTHSRPRGRRRRRRRGASSHGSYSTSYSSSSSSTGSSSRRRRSVRRRTLAAASGAIAVSPGGALALPAPPGPEPESPQGLKSLGAAAGSGRPSSLSLGELLRGAQPPLPDVPLFPDVDTKAVSSKPSRLLAPASERNLELESFLAKHRITPSTSFLMLKLTREQATMVMKSVNERLAQIEGPRSDRDAEDAALARLKVLGIRTTSAGGGSWTSTERTASPGAARVPVRDSGPSGDKDSPSSNRGLSFTALPGLPSLDGLLGPSLTSLPIDDDGEPDCELVPGAGEVPVTAQETVTNSTDASTVPGATQVPEGAQDVAAAATTRVFVKNIDKSIGEKELRDLFGRHGTVGEVDIPRDKETGLGKGFAFVTLARPEEAFRCIKALHFTKPWGRALIVEKEVNMETAALTSEAAAPSTAGLAEPPRSSCSRSRERTSDKDSMLHENEKEIEQGKVKEREKKKDCEKDKTKDSEKHKDREKRRRETSGKRRHKSSSKSRSESRKRHSSRSGSSNDSTSSGGSRSSGWSRYTLPSKSKGTKARPRRRRRSGKRRRHGSRSSDSSYSWCTSRGHSQGMFGDDRMPPMMDGMGMGWMPTGPPPFSLGGMPPAMMPPPWAMPPWGMPPPMFDENGFPGYDREEAERQLRRAERRAKREEHRGEGRKDEVWADHPARVAQRKRSRSRNSSSPSRIPQRARSGSSNRRSKSRRGRQRSAASRRRRSHSRRAGSSRRPDRRRRSPPHGLRQGPPPMPGWRGPPPGLPPFGMPPGAPLFQPTTPSKSRRHRSGQVPDAPQQVDSDDSDVDLDKVQEEINFADI